MNWINRRFFMAGMTSAAGLSFCPEQVFAKTAERLRFRLDDALERAAPLRAPGSHVKLYLPSFPHIYTSHAVSAGFLRPARNAQGWEYDLAEKVTQIDSVTYRVSIRSGLKFQDGSPFTADSVILNVEAFLKDPFLFTLLHQNLLRAEKIDALTVDFHLKEKYGAFVQDLIWLHFYTPAYLEKNGWHGEAWCPNLKEPGPHGMGPFILTEGYIQGDRKTAVAKMTANPHYWRPDEPKVETITIYTQYDPDKILPDALTKEGLLDITPIPFDAKVQTITSDYAKVVTAPSNNNFAININMLNGNPKLKDLKVRVALNKALHQRNLLNFVYDGEGQIKATMVPPTFTGLSETAQQLPPYSDLEDPNDPATNQELKSILNGLTLRVTTMDSLLWLWKGIEFQLSKVGVTLDYNILSNETEIFGALFSIKADPPPKIPWDLIGWRFDDWYFNHPWSVFLLYNSQTPWSFVPPNPEFDSKIAQVLTESIGSPELIKITAEVMRQAHDQAYLLNLPGPNQVVACNKEVYWKPYRISTSGLWNIQVTPDHWSLRQGELSQDRKTPVHIVRFQ